MVMMVVVDGDGCGGGTHGVDGSNVVVVMEIMVLMAVM